MKKASGLGKRKATEVVEEEKEEVHKNDDEVEVDGEHVLFQADKDIDDLQQLALMLEEVDSCLISDDLMNLEEDERSQCKSLLLAIINECDRIGKSSESDTSNDIITLNPQFYQIYSEALVNMARLEGDEEYAKLANEILEGALEEKPEDSSVLECCLLATKCYLGEQPDLKCLQEWIDKIGSISNLNKESFICKFLDSIPSNLEITEKCLLTASLINADYFSNTSDKIFLPLLRTINDIFDEYFSIDDEEEDIDIDEWASSIKSFVEERIDLESVEECMRVYLFPILAQVFIWLACVHEQSEEEDAQDLYSRAVNIWKQYAPIYHMEVPEDILELDSN